MPILFRATPRRGPGRRSLRSEARHHRRQGIHETTDRALRRYGITATSGINSTPHWAIGRVKVKSRPSRSEVAITVVPRRRPRRRAGHRLLPRASTTALPGRGDRTQDDRFRARIIGRSDRLPRASRNGASWSARGQHCVLEDAHVRRLTLCREPQADRIVSMTRGLYRDAVPDLSIGGDVPHVRPLQATWEPTQPKERT
jgi:hypothetical protein